MHYPSGTFVRYHREMDEIGTRTCALKFFEYIAGNEINLRMLLCRSGFSRDVGAGLVPALFFGHVMIAPEGAPTGVVEDKQCRSGFSRDFFMGADHNLLTEGPLPLLGRGEYGVVLIYLR